MGAARYNAEFKNEAIKQVTDRGFSVKDVAKRLGITPWSLYTWMRKAGISVPSNRENNEEAPNLVKENACLKAQIRRLEEERDILKKAAAYFAKESR